MCAPKDHPAPEDTALQPQLSDLPAQLGQFLALVPGQALRLARSTRSRATQLPSVPSLIPRSRATWAIGFPVSRIS
jgi:hypothetical protein